MPVKFDQINIAQITGWIDKGLNEKSYIIPGLGDFGERRCVRCTSWYSSSPTMDLDIVNEESSRATSIITLLDNYHAAFKCLILHAFCRFAAFFSLSIWFSVLNG